MFIDIYMYIVYAIDRHAVVSWSSFISEKKNTNNDKRFSFCFSSRYVEFIYYLENDKTNPINFCRQENQHPNGAERN